MSTMPTYEYQCAKCKARYDLRQGFDAELTHTCEECGKGTAKRILHAPRVVFKGSGWYVTDSRKSKSAISGGPSTEADASAPETSEAPAAKSEKPAKKESGASPEAAAAS